MAYWMFRRAVIAAVLTALALAACSPGAGTPAPTATRLPGTVLDPPREIGDFTLTDQTGAPFRLSDLQGKVVVIFFGYTFCPDVCPISLADFRRVKAALGEQAERVAFVFISVDGERDTPERLAVYLGQFDPAFIGLTGDEVTLRTLGRDYGLFFQRRDLPESAVGYLVDHTSTTFVIGPEGRLRIIYPYATDPAIIAGGIRTLLG